MPDDETYGQGHLRYCLLRQTASEVYKQTSVPIQFVYPGATVCKNADLTAEISRRVLLANLRFRRYSLPLYDQPTPSLRLKVRMLKAEVMETMLYACVTWSPTVVHLAILRTARHRLLLRCIGRKK